MKFQLQSSFQPTGDQPSAIKQLTAGFKKGYDSQVLLGVTGSGKTFTVANLIQNLQKPTLVISHNKTLAAQLYQEFKEFFPQSAVAYFVSYYDYYQPEAYVPQTDTYIAKEADINQEIDKLRLQATSQIFSRQDVIVVASVSCIYNIGSPEQYGNRVLPIRVGQAIDRERFLHSLVSLYYQRSRLQLERGLFFIRGETVEIWPSYADEIIKISWEEGVVRSIARRSVFSQSSTDLDAYFLYPAKHYLADQTILNKAFKQIKQDLKLQLEKLKKTGQLAEATVLISE
jgi:excinuclease ABC subunit B